MRRPAPDFNGAGAASLAGILQLAFEAAVLPNRFEIDEQTPLSRLDALLEQVLAEVGQPTVAVPETERVFILRLVAEVAERVRTSIHRLPADRHAHSL
jgi:hypothetical protein